MVADVKKLLIAAEASLIDHLEANCTMLSVFKGLRTQEKTKCTFSLIIIKRTERFSFGEI